MKIAEFTELEIISPDGGPREFICIIGAPEERDSAWATSVTDPETGQCRHIFGEDSAQSLCLALNFIATRISDLHEKGFSWRYRGCEGEYKFEGHPIIEQKLKGL